MSQAISLDDLVKNNKKPIRKGNAGRMKKAGGAANGRSSSPRTKQVGRKPGKLTREPKGMVGNWGAHHQHDLRSRGGQPMYATQYNPQVVAVAPQSDANKLLLSNLASGVTDDDMKELFSTIGRLRTARVHFDSNGKCLGTAEIVFQRRGDAQKAFDKYKGFALDGKVLKMSVVSEGGSSAPVASRMTGPPMQQSVYGSPQQQGMYHRANGRAAPVYKTRNNRALAPTPPSRRANKPKSANGSAIKKVTTPKRTKLTLEDLNKEMDEFNSEKV